MATRFESIVSNPTSGPLIPEWKNVKDSSKNQFRNVKMFQDLTSLSSYEFALDETAREFETATITRELQEQQARQNYQDQMKQRDVAMNAQLEAYGRNQELIANQLAFNQQGAERALKDSETVYGDRLKAASFQEQELGYRREEQAIATASQLAALKVGDFEAQQNRLFVDAEAEKTKFLRDAAADLQFRSDINNSFNQLEAKQTETAFELQQSKLQEILNLGKARSAGRVGVSASRAEQTILALAGLNTTKLNDSLLRFTLNTEQEQVLISERRDQAKASSQAEYVSATNRAKSSEKIALAKSSIENQRLAEFETVINNRFDMNRRELGETLISALNGYKQSKEQIFFDKFKADAQAYAQRMATPQFADPPKTPFNIPKIEFIPPPVPVEVPQGQAPRQQQNKTSALGKVLQIGGMILGAVAAPVTAGGSLAVGAALAGAGTAASAIGGSGWI